MSALALELVGGPWRKRLAPRRAWVDDLPWGEPLPTDDLAARLLWTRTAFAEYAAAAAFGALASRFLAAQAPIDLVAAAGDFVVDEIVHTEVAARLALKLGGAVALEVDTARLVRPAESSDPIVAAAELAVITACVGEALTVPMLKLSRDLAGSALVAQALGTIVADEAHHAQIGWWFLDWADARLDTAARHHLGRVATRALAGLAGILGTGSPRSGLGLVSCAEYDPVFLAAVNRLSVAPLAAHGILVGLAALELDRAVACGLD